MKDTPTPKVLVAGIGNIFLGDDAFGSEVARRLEGRPWASSVKVVDFGIRGLDLAYALCEPHDLTVLIDATPRGGAPGTLYLIEPDLTDLKEDSPPHETLFDAHSLDPLQVLRMAHSQGAELENILLVGCEPGDLGGEEGRLGMTEPVAAAVEEALELVSQLVRNFLEDGTIDGRAPVGRARFDSTRVGGPPAAAVESAPRDPLH
jgi:hydrogenase maturation protease